MRGKIPVSLWLRWVTMPRFTREKKHGWTAAAMLQDSQSGKTRAGKTQRKIAEVFSVTRSSKIFCLGR